MTATTRPATTGLQPALPKPMYVDRAHWEREREQVLFASWFCV